MLYCIVLNFVCLFQISDPYFKIRKLLVELKLSSYIQTFLDNEVTDKDVFNLNEYDLKDLFDKVGPRSRFRVKLREMKENRKSGWLFG